MFRNYFSAAWGDLRRSPVQSFIAIGGLAIGLMAAIIAGVVTVDAFTRDHFVDGYDRLYLAVLEHHDAKRDLYSGETSYELASYLRGFPGVGKAARTSAGGPAVLRRGDILVREERMTWADPDFFRIYRVPVLYGDLDHALDRPDDMVISLAMARKYFGHDNVLGQSLELDHRPMTVRAVIADWVTNSGNYGSQLFASSLSKASPMSQDIGTQGMSSNGGLKTDMVTWVRVLPGASIAQLNALGTGLMSQFVPRGSDYHRALHFERSDELNMSVWLHPDDRAHLYVMEVVALVILVLSCVNFINLSVARSTQRGLEVAVRKAAGAERRVLIGQFLGEAILQALFALCVAIALVEWSLPAVNDFLQSAAQFEYWRNPTLAGALLTGAVVVGGLAGSYPAMILSRFRPTAVLKGGRRGLGSSWLRQNLVALQFAALIVFLIAAVTVFRQNQYSTGEAMRVSTNQMLFIVMPKCSDSMRDRMARLPGVAGAACSSLRVLPEQQSAERAVPRDHGPYIAMSMVPVNFGFFELFGLRPLAGRLFRAGAGDTIPDNPSSGQTAHYIINETAVRQLHYASAQAAIGQSLFKDVPPRLPHKPSDPPDIYPLPGVIIGVVKDFSFTPEMAPDTSVDKKISPIAYSVGNAEVSLSPPVDLLNLKLSGHEIPETLARIDAEWKKSGAVDPIYREFLNEYVQDREDTTRKEGEAFAVFAGIAMLLACLGLFGVALSNTARRIKEIGVRKAMGAGNGQVVALLLWQFAKPVLVANLIAWPVAWWAMDRWLASFPYHIDLGLWTFPAATGVALLVALATVSGQAWLAARQKPVLALRYE